MPRYDGTGPAGAGPMTGQGLGYCVLKDSPGENGAGIRGYAGLAGRPVPYASQQPQSDQKEAIRMPRGDGTGPMGMGPMTGRAAGFCAGYPTPGFMNDYYGGPGRTMVPAGYPPAGYPPTYAYGGVPFSGWRFPAGRFGLGLGRGWGRGRGRGRGRGWFGRGW
jgi:hypothetical protein